MFRKMPFVLVLVILAVVLLEPHVALPVKEVIYAISLTIKTLIIFVLPFIIFSLLFKAAVSLAHGATRVIAIILVGVCVSSCVALFFSHFIGRWVYQFDLSLVSPQSENGLKATWDFTLPVLVANSTALFSAIVAGILASLVRPRLAHTVAHTLEHIVAHMLKIITLAIPFFVAGFVMKMKADGLIHVIIQDYSLIFLVIAFSQMTYLLIAYFLLAKGKPSEFLQSIKNMIPAAISGFTTMASAASMPLTILGAEKNAHNKDLARSTIAATVNIHLVGDCFATPIFAYAILKTSGLPDPSLLAYLVFVFYFVVAKFSVAGIPGGGIIVMLPILETHLGFTPGMLSLITALYILFDPVITCTNVLGNGAFAKLMDRVMPSLRREKTVPLTP